MARFLLLGATGGTGTHFLPLLLSQSHHVRCLVRTPSKLPQPIPPNVEVIQGSITNATINFPALVADIDYVVVMLGDTSLQHSGATPVCDFIKKLIPAMRAAGVSRILYQAGGFSCPPNESLGIILSTLRYTIARKFEGQHRDNEAVMRYFVDECSDIEWMVHRAGIGGDGASKGVLVRSNEGKLGIGTFGDCARFSLGVVMDDQAVRRIFGSYYK